MQSVIRSKNTLSLCSLFDCRILRLQYQGPHLLVELSGMDVLRSHPNNPAGRAQHTGKARILFENCLLSDVRLDYRLTPDGRIDGSDLDSLDPDAFGAFADCALGGYAFEQGGETPGKAGYALDLTIYGPCRAKAFDTLVCTLRYSDCLLEWEGWSGDAHLAL